MGLEMWFSTHAEVELYNRQDTNPERDIGYDDDVDVSKSEAKGVLTQTIGSLEDELGDVNKNAKDEVDEESDIFGLERVSKESLKRTTATHMVPPRASTFFDLPLAAEAELATNLSLVW